MNASAFAGIWSDDNANERNKVELKYNMDRIQCSVPTQGNYNY